MSCFVLLPLLSSAQEKKDSIREIEEVVITGQHGSALSKKSVFKVDIITAEQIKQMALPTLADVLNQQLNVLIVNQNSSGDSKAEIMGLNAQYIKVLVDHIPLVSDTGLGYNNDLSKISADDIERIEIVKGGMGVDYGNNAVAGVINIITKKKLKKSWILQAYLQEETVRDEYDVRENGKGKHIQYLKIGKRLSPEFSMQASLSRIDFNGYQGEREGKKYFGRDGKRGYLWQPKLQHTPEVIVNYQSQKISGFSKTQWLHEEVQFYNPTVDIVYLGQGKITYTSLDREFLTKRFLQHIQLHSSSENLLQWTTDFSYQKQTRNFRDVLYDIPNRKIRSENPYQKFFETEVFYNRTTISRPYTHFGSWQAGYEADFTQGLAASIAGKFDRPGEDIKKGIFSVGTFGSLEWNALPDLSVRPGIRVILSNIYRPILNFSAALKYRLNASTDFRGGVSTTGRLPNFEERYTYMVDINHDIRGNENLTPERAYSGNLLFSHSKGNWKWDMQSLYTQVEDKIELAVVQQSPLQFRFVNTSHFQSWLNSVQVHYHHQEFRWSFGVSLNGIAREGMGNSNPNFLYNAEANTNISYRIKKIGTGIHLWMKYFGPAYALAENNNLGITQSILIKRSAFSLMDVSLQQEVWKKKMMWSIGVRNLLDVRQVDTAQGNGGSHGNAETGQNLFYGRSYFTRLSFDF